MLATQLLDETGRSLGVVVHRVVSTVAPEKRFVDAAALEAPLAAVAALG